MRILSFIYSLAESGGAELLAIDQARCLRALEQDVRLLTFRLDASAWSDALGGLAVEVLGTDRELELLSLAGPVRKLALRGRRAGRRFHSRLRRIFERRVTDRIDERGERDHELFVHLASASVHSRAATGEDHVRPLPALFAPQSQDRPTRASGPPLVGIGAGFSLHAGACVPANRRGRLECRPGAPQALEAPGPIVNH